MSEAKEYTIGWICALATEYVAAQEMLDEEYDPPEIDSSADTNDYTLGRIGQHKVVIAALHMGTYGESSAASVAAHMQHSFPNVRIGLMVGIGGGAPSKRHDIRLGDIVVGVPGNGFGGVFQYDYGKIIQGEAFQYTGFLNQPPITLQTALTGIQAQYKRKGHRLEETVEAVLKRNLRLLPVHGRPPQETDRLFKSEVAHDPQGCTDFCASKEGNLKTRHVRTDYEDRVTIHYGTIASANSLMKDAVIRDRLSAEKDVLCFEMEAAGLMNHFPCLVIRGICDYSDSHKSEEWQGFAAMVAAAYTRDLISRIMPAKIEAEKKIGDILSTVCSVTSKVHANVEMITSEQSEKKVEAVLNWITPVEHGLVQSDHLQRHQKGTGQWFLESKEFHSWLGTKGQTLFCPGMPGAGKTVLASITVQNLFERFHDDTTVGIAYLYCNYRLQGEQTAQSLLASLLKQLSRWTVLPESVRGLHAKHKRKGTRMSLEEITQTLKSVVGLFTRMYIIVDALDECQASNGSRSELMKNLSVLQAKHGANILATSRPIPDISDSIAATIVLPVSANDEDVGVYIGNRIPQLPRFIRESSALQEEIRLAIIESVQGMFLLAKLHMDSLVGKTTPKALRIALSKLPSGSDAYDYAYQRAMERINGQIKDHGDLANNVILWITHAREPLRTRELQMALAIMPDDSGFDEDNCPQIEDMVSVCAGLVTIEAETDTIRLIHYTTQEYFEKTKSQWFPNGENSIATICITCLSFDVFGTGPLSTRKHFRDRVHSNPLYIYAARHWGDHAQESFLHEERVTNFLESPAKVESSWQGLLWKAQWPWMHLEPWTRYSNSASGKTGMHLAAWFGLHYSASALIQRGHSPDPADTYGATPLSFAAMRGHVDIVELLLQSGSVDVNSEICRPPNPLFSQGPMATKEGWTPLHFAAENGYKTIASLLLNKGANFWAGNEKYYDGGNEAMLSEPKGDRMFDAHFVRLWELTISGIPSQLDVAVKNGHETVVNLLLQQGAGIDRREGVHFGRLHEAAMGRCSTVLDLLLKSRAGLQDKDDKKLTLWAFRAGILQVLVFLLQNGADVEANDPKFGRSMLSWAAGAGKEMMVEHLLEADADIHSKDQNGRTPLSWAAGNGMISILKGPLGRAADLESADNKGRTILSWAAGNDQRFVVKADQRLVVKDLLEKCVKINTADKNGRTPLSWAAENGQCSIILDLLERDAKIDAADQGGRTPLSWAAENGHSSVIRDLLTKDAKIDIADKDGRTPLSWAAENGHSSVIRDLLTKDAKIDIADKDGRTPLSWAAGNGHISVIKDLLKKDAKIDIADRDGRTPLSWAAGNGFEDTVQALLDQKADANISDQCGWTPLWYAVHGTRRGAVATLLEAGCRIKLADNDGSLLLRQAIWDNEEKETVSVVVDLLLRKGADIDQRQKGSTLLSWAACEGRRNIVKLLCDKGAGTEVVDLSGRTPLSSAAEHGHVDVVKYLLDKGARIESADEHGRTPLSWAAWRGQKEVVSLLLHQGADVDCADKRGRTPVWYANFSHNEDIAQLLSK